MLAAILGLLICGCTSDSGSNQRADDGESGSSSEGSGRSDHPFVIVTSQPLFELASEIAGNEIRIVKLPDQDVVSRNWTPTRSAVRTMQDAAAVIISGAGYEPWRDRVSLPGSRLHNSSSGYFDRLLRIPDAITHQHGPEGMHSHPGTVWATWLDPRLARAQAAFVTAVLRKLAPSGSETMDRNAARLMQEFDILDEMIDTLALLIRKTIQAGDQPSEATSASRRMVFRSDGPFYQYLTERLDVQLQYLHWNDSGDCTETELRELQDVLQKTPADSFAMFLLNSRKVDSAAEFVSSRGLNVVRIDLCEFPSPERVNMMDRWKGNLERLNAAVAVMARENQE